MKTITTPPTGQIFGIFLLVVILFSGFSAPRGSSLSEEPPLKGAWEMISYNEGPLPVKVVQIFSHNYFMSAEYDLAAKVFSRSMGGFYDWKDNTVTLRIDYHTLDSSMVGQSHVFKVKTNDDGTLTWKGKVKEEKITVVWKRIDDGNAPLAGAWVIGRRVGQTGEMRDIVPGPRKTVKILSGTRFQWTAMNTETKEFFGTGGGTYSLKDGVYTENIEFFSRDSTRVGASLSFDGKVEGNEWFHSGQSSRGAPINEVWIRQ
ncbi:MAG: membrane or secreted protein [Bacteroidia bacterium]|nr:membrane or secreted protein [Bacteroidia bacterium]